ncbi:MAG: hypothetical protein AB7E51_03640 [Pseudodesulfovibrio sp.]|uniref:hypothetical protein n=1 Tax=Pseudodesulfovibrio sp. TaxID=2035812 RepID=UPI003D13EE05
MKHNLKDYFDSNDQSPPTNTMGPLHNFNGWQFNLWLNVKGKTPTVIAKKMAEEFFHQFPYATRSMEDKEAQETYKFFLAAGENTWAQLDYGIKLMARLFDPDLSQLKFWDRMRYIAKACRGDFGSAQKRQVYRKEARGLTYEQSRPIEKIDHCHLCWRGVPRRKGVKSQVYCPIHYSLDTSEHRRRKRMLSKVIGQGNGNYIFFSDIFQSMTTTFAPYKKLHASQNFLNTNESIKNVKSKITLDEIWFSNPLHIINKMPYVSEYLTQNAVDITSAQAIVTALEKTESENLREDELNALERFYQESALYFDAYYEHLILAEIWLKLDSTTKHGGKRTGAGRKSKP